MLRIDGINAFNITIFTHNFSALYTLATAC